jgi:hypothetical protein
MKCMCVYAEQHRCVRTIICLTALTQVHQNGKQRAVLPSSLFLIVACVVSVIPVWLDAVSHLLFSVCNRILGLSPGWLFSVPWMGALQFVKCLVVAYLACTCIWPCHRGIKQGWWEDTAWSTVLNLYHLLLHGLAQFIQSVLDLLFWSWCTWIPGFSYGGCVWGRWFTTWPGDPWCDYSCCRLVMELRIMIRLVSSWYNKLSLLIFIKVDLVGFHVIWCRLKSLQASHRASLVRGLPSMAS